MAARLEELGKRPIPTATAAGLGRDFISDILNGKKQSVRGDKLAALATALEMTPDEVLHGRAGEHPLPLTVPLVGFIGAGDASHYYAQDQVGTEYGEVEADDAGGISAREIKGRSMGKMLEGWLVYTGPRQVGVPDKFYGRICEVGLPDGRVLIKKVTRSKLFENAVNLLSETEDPILDQVIEWSAVVTSMRPR